MAEGSQPDRTAVEVAVIERDLLWIKQAMERQDRVLGEIKDLAQKTNGRVNTHDEQHKVANHRIAKLESGQESDRKFLYKLGGGITALNCALTAALQFFLKKM